MSISEHFNNSFTNIRPNLVKLIPLVNKVHMAYLGDAVQDTIFIEHVTCDEISTIVSNLKNNATGFDEISAVYLKCLCQVLQVHCCIFVICLFQKMCFPHN